MALAGAARLGEGDRLVAVDRLVEAAGGGHPVAACLVLVEVARRQEVGHRMEEGRPLVRVDPLPEEHRHHHHHLPDQEVAHRPVGRHHHHRRVEQAQLRLAFRSQGRIQLCCIC